jgi:hypothetical protein
VHGARRGSHLREPDSQERPYPKRWGRPPGQEGKQFPLLTWWVAHREGGSCKDGIERERLKPPYFSQCFTLCNGLVQENLPKRDGATREGERQGFRAFDFFLFPATPAKNRSLTNHARGGGCKLACILLSLFDFFFAYPFLAFE